MVVLNSRQKNHRFSFSFILPSFLPFSLCSSLFSPLPPLPPLYLLVLILVLLLIL